MDLRETLYRHRKDNRFILAVLGGALLFLTLVYFLILQGRDLPQSVVTNSILLIFLRNINVLLIAICLFVLFRNLIKLWVERRNATFGSKFRTKLVATYVALSLFPVLVLFAYASEIIQGSVENLFRSPVAEVLAHGDAISRELDDRILGFNQLAADRVTQRIAPITRQDAESRGDLAEVLRRSLRDEGLDLILLYEETEFVKAVVNSQAGPVQVPELGSAFLLRAIREGSATQFLDSSSQQRLLLAASSLERDGLPTTVVVTGTALDLDLTSSSNALKLAYRDYLQLQVQKPELKATYMLTFLMITLVILLTSTWVGLYLARRVTVPIQALAEGTRRIAAGDLSHRVDVSAGDELGVLVKSFNSMTTDLSENKALLEHQNRELTEINRNLDDERGRIRAVLQNVAAGVLAVDQDGKISTCNEAALEMLHQTEAQVLGQTLESAWSDDQRRKLLALFEYDPLGRSRREVQLRLGGQWKTLEVHLSTMFDAAGEITGHVLVLEDLTELIQAQQLATWSEAARRIAHEIKNPLTPIKLAAERMLHKHRADAPDLGSTLEDGVATIVREVESMKQMVDEFSRFARMPMPQPADVDLESLFGDTLELYRNVKPGLELSYSVDASTPTARFDKEQMRGVLVNLIDNAVEATEAPGKINLLATSSNGSVVLSVADTGSGIPAGDKEKLFQPYFSTKGRGTGLGLAIVFRVVNDHRGTIHVEDNEPTGTVFRIELPQ